MTEQPLSPAHQSLSRRISLAARLQRTRFDQRARRLGITLAQWRALDAVSRSEGATQRRIAELIGVGDVTAGRLIDRLVEKKWIKRRTAPDDRRAHRLYLTRDAESIIEQITAMGEEAQRMTLAGICESEAVTMLALLDRVVANLEADSEIHAGSDQSSPQQRVAQGLKE